MKQKTAKKKGLVGLVLEKKACLTEWDAKYAKCKQGEYPTQEQVSFKFPQDRGYHILGQRRIYLPLKVLSERELSEIEVILFEDGIAVFDCRKKDYFSSDDYRSNEYSGRHHTGHQSYRPVLNEKLPVVTEVGVEFGPISGELHRVDLNRVGGAKREKLINMYHHTIPKKKQ